eukprot:1043121-Rhodomonas_salina.2
MQHDCAPCPFDHVCSGVSLTPPKCPAHATTLSQQGVSDYTGCFCREGFFHTAPSDPCIYCPPGFWCAGGQASPTPCTPATQCPERERAFGCTAKRDFSCQPCLYPAFTAPMPPAWGGGECAWVCDAGYFLTNGICIKCLTVANCPLGQHTIPCTNTTNARCALCPAVPEHGVYHKTNSCVATCSDGYWYNAQTHTCCNNAAYAGEGGSCMCLPGWVASGDECLL